MSLGLGRARQDDHAGARREYEQAIAIWERAYGPDHVLVADCLAIHEKALGLEHPDLGYDLTSLGECRLDQDRPVEAVALLERALALREGSGGDPRLAEETRVMLDRARGAVRPEGRSD